MLAARGTLGRYRIEEILHCGARTILARGQHETLPRPFALQLLRDPHPAAKARFSRANTVLSHIKSDHMVEVFDAGEDPSGAPYAVLRLLDGIDLRRALVERGPMSVDEVL